MKIKTSELTGAALDWAVAVCLGAVWQPKSVRASFFIWPGAPVKYSAHAPRYSTDWAQGGPIIEREGICLRRGHSGWWIAYSLNVNDEEQFVVVSPTPLIAAMRCYVASKLGDEVEVPEELT